MRIKSLILLTLAFLTASTVFFFFLSLHMFTSASEKNEVRGYAEKAELLQRIFRNEAGNYRLLIGEHAPTINAEELMGKMQSEYSLHPLPEDLSLMTKIQFMGVFSPDFSEYYAASAPDFEDTAEEALINIMKVRSEIKGFITRGGTSFTVGIPSKNQAMLIIVFPVGSPVSEGYLLTGYLIDRSFIASLYSSFGFEAGVARTPTKTKPEYTHGDRYSNYSVELLSKSAARVNITFKDLNGAEVLHIFFPVKRSANMELAYQLNTSSLYFVFFSIVCLAGVFLIFYRKIVLPLHSLTGFASGSKDGGGDPKRKKQPAEFTEIETALKKITDKTEMMERNLSKISSADSLTGILNMRFFDEIFFFEWQSATRNKAPIGLLIADLDNFKLYNREYGYSEGDKCIVKITEIIKETVKDKTDIIARRSGEEFIILMPAADKEACIRAAEDILAAVRNRSIPNAASEEKIVTLSIGLCSLIPSKDDSKELIVLKAEQALYEAKKQKNIFEAF